MATKQKQETKKGGESKKGSESKKGGESKGGAKQQVSRREHKNSASPAPAPRLRGYYETTVRERLMGEFGLANVHEIPRLSKIVVNVGHCLHSAVISIPSTVKDHARDSSFLRPGRDLFSDLE